MATAARLRSMRPAFPMCRCRLSALAVETTTLNTALLIIILCSIFQGTSSRRSTLLQLQRSCQAVGISHCATIALLQLSIGTINPTGATTWLTTISSCEISSSLPVMGSSFQLRLSQTKKYIVYLLITKSNNESFRFDWPWFV